MNYFTKIKGVRETEEGTEVLLEIPDTFIEDKIRKVASGSSVNTEIIFDDKRRINSEQLKKIWATINDIADYQGWLSAEELKVILVEMFCQEKNIPIFSLSRRKENSASILIARDFITYLIDFCIEWEIPLLDLAVNRTEDIDKYIYRCLITRTCVITGEKGADIHHVTGSRIGMGRNRYKIDHSNLEIIPLSRKWHNKVHAEGEYEIFKRYKVYAIKLDLEGLKKLGLNYEDLD